MQKHWRENKEEGKKLENFHQIICDERCRTDKHDIRKDVQQKSLENIRQ